ncbi:MAG: SMC domain protein [candidate division TM6 bacterium GW2011_GWE2_41_16]|nr:MAG: SMC domain protein [candidate division TM6 bacterium GW2011_GWE2_41_16]
MIPLTLSLKNFLSYGPATQTIDFSAHRFICLSGKNGHGKSALLDAITWALWGQARKLSGQGKSDDVLMHLGQTHMLVSFDFMLNNVMYRTMREFSLNKNKSVGSLEFYLIETNTQKMLTLTEKTIRATQDKINKTLGIEYEAFCNSIFLRQGGSAEFSKKNPKERKEILAQLLSLNIYEQVRKKALDKEKELKIATAELSALLSSATKLAEQEIKNQQITNTLSEQERVNAPLLETIQQHLQHTLDESFIKNARLWEVHAHISSFENQRKAYAQIIQTIRSCISNYRITRPIKTSKSLDEYLQSIKEHELAAAEHQAITQKICLLQNELKQRTDHLEGEIQKKLTLHAHTRIEAEKKQAHALSTHMQLTDMHTKNQARIAEKNAALEKIPLAHQHIDQLTNDFEHKKRVYSRLVHRGKELKKLYGKLKIEYEQLSSLRASCPQCRQAISDEHKKELFFDLSRTKNRLERRMRDIDTFLFKLKALIDQTQHTITQEMNRFNLCKEISTLQEEALRLDQETRGATQILTECTDKLCSTQNVHQQTTRMLQTKAYLTEDTVYQSIRAHIEECGQKANVLKYDMQSHQQILQEYQRALASQQHGELRTKIYQTIAQARDLKKNLTQTNLENEQKVLLNEINELKKMIDACELKKRTIEDHLLHVRVQKAALESERVEIVKQKVLFSEHEQKKTQLETDMAEYAILAESLSKDGIQALLIEQALPEIETDANELLSELSDTHAQLKIESLKDLKSGKTKETLDITISDTIGTRPYEMFSGGEAFRIDFALRIALAKLLARRAGTTLQTLIIDEGFGSQDEEGLSRIIEALYRVQKYFSKIIIVSHLPTLKDQFDVHYVVTKGPRGSSVAIN